MPAAITGEKAGAVVEAYLKRECDAVRAALSHASPSGPWLAAGPIRPGVRVSGNGTGVFLIGNAAGEAHPIVGEGISMAMQSAWLLCEQLVHCRDVLRPAGSGQREIQRRYATQWRAHFGRRLRLAAWFAEAAMRPSAMTCLLPVLRRAPALLTRSARWSGKIRCAPTAAAIALLAPAPPS